MSDHTILLGGVGGDSHSVGLTILRQALSASGYKVHYLGTQNTLENFFQHAALCNVVMVSSMDGHTRYYVRDFPELIKKYRLSGPLWYLGGMLDIGSGCERYFLEMGFDQVFLKFIDVSAVLQILERDLAERSPVTDCTALWERSTPRAAHLSGPVLDVRVEPDTFQRSRCRVLECWETGRSARSLEDNAEFLGRQASFPMLQRLVNAKRLHILIQPRSGVPLLEQQIELFKAFKHAGVRVLSYQVDSLTRNNNYRGAEEAINESAAHGMPTINGFPVINHGVPGLRRIISEVNVPLQTRHSTRDPRLLAEISYAGGVTAFEGGAICYNIPYYKDYPLDEAIRNWQYVDRLTGLYRERFGITLDREFFGTLTATLIPPSLAITVDLIEALLAIRQGVKSVSLGYAEQGHRIQDIAAVRALGRLGDKVLRNLGGRDVQISTTFHQYMAAFPEDRRRAQEVIYNSAVTATLSGATRILVKTPVEAIKIPSMRDNIDGINLTSQGVAAAARETFDEGRVAEECALIEREAQAMLESVIFAGRGDIAKGVVTGFKSGFIDVPFSPSIYNRGAVMTARDTEGAVRFLSTGNLAFDAELREFHQERMEERRHAEGLSSSKQDYLLVEKDVLQIPRHSYERWPLYK